MPEMSSLKYNRWENNITIQWIVQQYLPFELSSSKTRLTPSKDNLPYQLVKDYFCLCTPELKINITDVNYKYCILQGYDQFSCYKIVRWTVLQ